VEERFFWLGKERPAFEAPERFTFFIWPHSIGYLEESGLGDIIRRRLEQGDDPQVAQSLQQLYALERRATFDAIKGRNHHTLWERTS
jgi:hypothetical protein